MLDDTFCDNTVSGDSWIFTFSWTLGLTYPKQANMKISKKAKKHKKQYIVSKILSDAGF